MFRLLSAGRFQLPDAAAYLSRSITTLRRLIKRGTIQRLPGFRDIVITKAECDRYLREQQDIGKLGV